ncbi:hypothetical protein BT96DRAFT_1008017 [Gymnopus androsaceus JB14]|uniref:Uncharacterized protein n=1 Tax=Gymnopus androsaceus JB14 TaxID=1447944 RepID=A0A6A4GG09_9AGAR|nr:hypothetical protein BT96DRAFT_1008017 [Gymnopus androsaceus JB14]
MKNSSQPNRSRAEHPDVPPERSGVALAPPNSWIGLKTQFGNSSRLCAFAHKTSLHDVHHVMKNLSELDRSRAEHPHVPPERSGVVLASPNSQIGLNTQFGNSSRSCGSAHNSSQHDVSHIMKNSLQETRFGVTQMYECRRVQLGYSRAGIGFARCGEHRGSPSHFHNLVTARIGYLTQFGNLVQLLLHQNIQFERIEDQLDYDQADRVHPRIDSGGQTHRGEDPRKNVRNTDGDRWADISQTGLRPSCHPRSSDSEISPPDVSLTLPVSSSPPPTPVPPTCIDPHPESIQEERFTPRKAMPSKLTVVHGTTVNSCFGTTRPSKRDWMDC